MTREAASVIWRRQGKARDDDGAGGQRAPEERTAWEELEARWDQPEEDRVASWLRAKGGRPALQTVPVEPVPDDPYTPPVIEEWAQDHPEERDRDRGVGFGSHAQLSDLRAEVAALEVARDRLEAEVSALAAEVSVLEERRHHVAEDMESAAASAERARAAELAAVAHLEDVREQAKRVEAEQFEIWVTLDAEVTALRQRLRATGGPDQAANGADPG